METETQQNTVLVSGLQNLTTPLHNLLTMHTSSSTLNEYEHTNFLHPHSTVSNQKIGIWHESIPNQCKKTELQFKNYCNDYINYIAKKKITRAFFLIQDPFFCPYVKQNWVVTYWLDKLPSNCEAGFVLDTEPDSPWNGSPNPWTAIGGTNDMMELAFQEVVRLNSLAISKKVTCIGFDTENLYLGGVKDTGYSTKDGSSWITKMFQTYLPGVPVDWGWASGRIGGDSTLDIGGARYPEIYWVGETSPACNIAGGGDACSSAQNGTDYCTSLNDVNKLLSGPIGNALKSFSESNQNQQGWAMFSVEKWTKGTGECVASYNTDLVDAPDMIPKVKYTIVSSGTTNFILCGASSNIPGTEFTATAPSAGTGQVTKSAICGLLDAFGIWDESTFDTFLATVQTNYSNVPKVMIYEWNFIPQGWI
uniref:Uncharacterized protein n=1 Tax=viral metagenome TaxID=1070528 RepID=A0A6C0IID3_9ZZZZ